MVRWEHGESIAQEFLCNGEWVVVYSHKELLLCSDRVPLAEALCVLDVSMANSARLDIRAE